MGTSRESEPGVEREWGVERDVGPGPRSNVKRGSGFDGFAVSAPCRSCWRGPQQPAEPAEFLRALPEELRTIRALGAALVEFHADLCVIDSAWAAEQLWNEVAELLGDQGLGATLHLPYVWVDLAALDQEVWEGSVRSVETALRVMAPLRPRMAAVHPANHATWSLLSKASRDELVGFYPRLATQLLAALQRLKRMPGGEVLALENLEGMPLDLYRQVLTGAQVGACLDVGHLVSNGDEVIPALRNVADRLMGLHVHDGLPPEQGQFMGHAHLPFGNGVLDLDELFDELVAVDFSGPLVVEVDGELAEAVRTLVERIKTH